MAKNKNKRKNGVIKDGSYNTHTKKDIYNINTSYYKKLEEYEKMSLEELEELGKKTKLGGSYRLAYLQTLAKKKQKNE